MSSTVFTRWNAKELLGFWFLTNFLREDVPEEMVMAIIKAITVHYDAYLIAQKKSPFGPRFRTIVMDTRAEEVRIVMEDPKLTGEAAIIGHVDLLVNDAGVSILADETA
jgi:hypothetical protein